MTDLYELTRAFVRRGCPEHPRLLWVAGLWMDHHPLKSDRRAAEVHDDDARAIWTCWALEWWLGLSPTHSATYWVSKRGIPSHWIVHHADGRGASPNSPTILEAIEAATRHLEPTND